MPAAVALPTTAPSARHALGRSLVAISLLVSAAAFAGSPNWQSLTYNNAAPGLDWNPGRGLVAFPDGMNSSFPHSLVMNYVALSSVMTGSNTFNWNSFETSLNNIGNAGYQSIVRFYLDYPNSPVGTPQFLINQGVTMSSYTDYSNGANYTSKDPNWNDSRVITACQQFVAAFGKAYDGDPRIGFVQVGLYGFWGEWHTYPHDGADDPPGYANWQMNQTNKDAILTAYKNAFVKTQVILRDPAGTTNSQLKSYFGYHDDSFASQTITSDPNLSYYFWPKMTAASLQNQWIARSMGGELYPGIQSAYWNAWPNTTGQDWTNCVNTTHVSWMVDDWVFNNSLTQTQWNNALKGHRMLGYQLNASQVLLPNTTQKTALTVGITLKNLGAAPPPYNWSTSFAVLNSSNTIISHPFGTTVDSQLQAIQPGGAAYTRDFAQANHGLAVGDYTLVYQIQNPLSAGPKVALANAAMGQNLAGWLTLGSFSVGPYLEAENLNLAAYSGPDVRVVADAGASNSEYDILDATAVGNSVTYTVPNLQARTYDVFVGTKTYNTRGICQLAVAPSLNGAYTDHGSPIDQYSSAAVFSEIDVGSFTPGTAGDKSFRFTVTGKNASSSGYSLAFDYIALVPQ